MVPESGQAVEFLEALGLTEHEARALYSLFAHPDATPSEISRSSGIPLNKIYPALELLEGKGLVRYTPSRPKKYRPLEPQAVLDALMRRQEEKLAVIRECKDSVTALLNKFYDGGRAPRGAAWMAGTAAVRKAALEGMLLAKEKVKFVFGSASWRLMLRDTEASAAAMMLPLARGVRVYTVIPSAVFAGPGSLKDAPKAWLGVLAHDGFHARVLDDGRMRNAFMIVDDALAGLAMSRADTGAIRCATPVTDGAGVKDIIGHFEELWTAAAPAENELRRAAKSLLAGK